MKHTQGPWTVKKTRDECFYIESGDAPIADVHEWTGSHENLEASKSNAYLIAAAPEMLDMLEKLSHLHESGQWHNEVEKLIKKAKGE